MNFLAQAAAKAEARFTEALNKVDSAAAPALEKAKDRLEETTSQIAEKVTEKANELGLKDLGLGVGDRQPTQPPVPRPRGDDSSAERPKRVAGAGSSSEALAREAVDKIVEAKHHSDMTHAETRARRFNDGERNRLAEEKYTDASSETTPPPVASRDTSAATEGSDAGGMIEDKVAAVPTPDPSVPAPLDDSPAEPEPPRKKTALELLKERRTARRLEQGQFRFIR